MIYNVIGVMSGSSLDGLDLAFVEIVDAIGNWSFELKNSKCIPYDPSFAASLQDAAQLSVPEFLNLNTAYGKLIGNEINTFINENELFHKVNFIASHGHTVYHNPARNTSTQIGDGATIAATTGITTISDLRNMDVALNGQGAPIVPFADKLLFNEYDFCLNIGGISNISIKGAQPIAFDICPANQLLNHYAQLMGKDFDKDGVLASNGKCNVELLNALNQHPFYAKEGPKSLDNDFKNGLIATIEEFDISNEDKLCAIVHHIVYQIAESLKPYAGTEDLKRLLITGGGAFNQYLIQCLADTLIHQNITVTIETPDVIQYKEAIAMGLLGVLRWREENNVLSSVTGADRDSIGGAMWLGNQ